MSLFYPDYRFNSLMEITPEDLKQMGVLGVAIDLDNTTAHDHTDTPLDGAIEWVEETRKAGFKVMILSNGKELRAKNFAELLGDIEYQGMSLKPLRSAYIKAQKRLNLNPKNIVMIGDQIFTDILGANLSGWKSAYVKPFAMEQRNVRSYKIRRGLEKKIFSRMDKKNNS